MVRFKVVFRDESNEKCIYGDVTFEDTLIKVLGDEGNLVYINKNSIVFMKEIREQRR